MADGTGRPLVTFYVIAYNQSRFVREAVESALAQTYSPLEILLSDDCSHGRHLRDHPGDGEASIRDLTPSFSTGTIETWD